MSDDETMVINGVEYVKKEAMVKKPVTTTRTVFQQFSKKEFDKLTKTLSKLKSWEEEPITTAEALKDEEGELGVMDGAKVSMIVAKSKRAKVLLAHYIPREEEKEKVPELKYDISVETSIKAKYSQDYLAKIFEFFNHFEQSVTIRMLPDYPLTVENEDFKIILAPRVDAE